jgi:DnaJ family protein A protein 3
MIQCNLFNKFKIALKVLGDEKKRQQYDAFGMAGEPGAQGFGGASSDGGYQYQSQVDPEELFRTIFGDAFKRGSGFESMFDNLNYENATQNEITQVAIQF